MRKALEIIFLLTIKNKKMKLKTLLSLFAIALLVVACSSDDSSCIEQTWYQDADGDGFGNANQTQSSCTQPNGYVSDNTDCDDSDSNTNPGAQENTTDGIDNDCDGLTDECIEDADCSGVCINGVCYDLCDTDDDCPPGTTCVDLGGGLKVCQ